MSVPQSHKPELLEIVTADGYSTPPSRFNTKVRQPLGDLIVAGARGARGSARHACSRGFNTITLDYLGVGSSNPETLKGFQVSFIDWATLDQATAVDFIKKEERPLLMVGHSFGGVQSSISIERRAPSTYLVERVCPDVSAWHR